MNNKGVIGIAAAAVIAFAAGLFFGPWFTHGGKIVTAAAVVPVFGVISIDAGGVCTQEADLNPSAFPLLEPPNSASGKPPNSISWFGRDKNGAKAPLVIVFPDKFADGSVGTPFVSGNPPMPKTTFTDGENTGPPSQPFNKNFPFQSVTVGGIPCSNITIGSQPLGVHVDR